jgi:anti-sigma B factor antagonist
MMIEARDAGTVTVLALTGMLTLDSGGELREAVQQVLSRQRCQVLIDLSHVTYVDSCGLGEVLQVYTTLRRRGGNLKLLKVTPQCRQLLTVAKLLNVLEIFNSEPVALKSFPANTVPMRQMN